MTSLELNEVTGIRQLVGVAQQEDLPVVVQDGSVECLVVMRPAVFERLLFGGNAIDDACGVPLRF